MAEMEDLINYFTNRDKFEQQKEEEKKKKEQKKKKKGIRGIINKRTDSINKMIDQI